MTRGIVRHVVIAVGLTLVIALIGVVSAWVIPVSASPEPGPTSVVTVVIPSPSGSPTPSATPTPRPSGSNPNPSPSGTDLPTLPDPAACLQTDADGAAIAPKAPDAPATEAEKLTFDPKTGTPGGRVTPAAEGFVKGEKVEVFIFAERVSIGTLTARDGGTFSGSFVLPADTSIGIHTIELLGWTTCTAAVGDLAVESNPGDGSSIFPWIVWLIVGIAILLAALLLLLANRLGWIRGRVPGGPADV